MMSSVPAGTWCVVSRRLLTTMTSVNSPVAAAAALPPSQAVGPPARPGFVLGDLEADQARCVLVPIYVEVLLSEGPDVHHVVSSRAIHRSLASALLWQFAVGLIGPGKLCSIRLRFFGIGQSIQFRLCHPSWRAQ